MLLHFKLHCWPIGYSHVYHVHAHLHTLGPEPSIHFLSHLYENNILLSSVMLVPDLYIFLSQLFLLFRIWEVTGTETPSVKTPWISPSLLPTSGSFLSGTHASRRWRSTQWELRSLGVACLTMVSHRQIAFLRSVHLTRRCTGQMCTHMWILAASLIYTPLLWIRAYLLAHL